MTKEVVYWPDGSTYEVNEFTYDKKGRLIREKDSAYVSKFSNSNITMYLNDESDIILYKAKVFLDDDGMEKDTTYFDNLGHAVKRIYQKNSKNPVPPEITYWEYNASGRMTKKYVESSEGQKIIDTSWNYDQFGNVSKEIHYNKLGDAIDEILYIYSK
jgi:hypothetical protein